MIIDGKVVKTTVKSLLVGEISGVDFPAQVPAEVSIMKRMRDLAKQATMALTTVEDEHQHLITMGGGSHISRAGSTDHVDDHSHSWLMDDAGNLVVAMADGHTHGIQITTKVDLPAEVSKHLFDTGTPEPVTSDSPSGTTAANNGINKDHSMTQPKQSAPATDVAAVEKKHQDEVATLTKRLERSESVTSLSTPHREHFNMLKGDDAETFLKADSTEKDNTILKAQEANQVVYKSLNGEEYRKSDDARLVAMAKTADEEKKKRMFAEEKAKKSDLTKRASELEHIPGGEAVRVSLLKGIDALPEAEQEPALAALKAQSAVMGKAFKRVGTTNAPEVGTENEDPVMKVAQELLKSDPALGTIEQAYTKVLSTPEGTAAYEDQLAKRQR